MTVQDLIGREIILRQTSGFGKRCGDQEGVLDYEAPYKKVPRASFRGPLFELSFALTSIVSVEEAHPFLPIVTLN